MVVRLALVVAAAAGFASAQLKVLAPGGPNLWWVANEENNVVWNCKDSQFDNFTILLKNSNPAVLSGADAIVSIQQNFDCSETLTTQQANFTAATGYTLLLANTLNSSDVYASSDPFEVKAQGSAYPASSATPVADSTSTSSSSASTSSSSGSSSSSQTSGALTVLPNGAGAFGALLAGAFVLSL
ncbi:hypothetical protein EW145_g4678 [Phellinidium pouzarii]|uniref:Uncharacterized protein n=1 Tax=Phellinidium pouzarii TaxID=167371 RepID=A0A4S4L405_9AGAM|nr:hypothetical protein EW145_g4678 [Phellinidium pouzarii]